MLTDCGWVDYIQWTGLSPADRQQITEDRFPPESSVLCLLPSGGMAALTDAKGTCVQTYEYSVYGHVAAEDPNHPNPFMFTGRQFDVETGLYYYRARPTAAHTNA